jgi:hypothetical protein
MVLGASVSTESINILLDVSDHKWALGVNLLYVNDNNFWLLFHFSLPLKRI